MDIAGSIALVTGANGGIGSVFVKQLLARGASKIQTETAMGASLPEPRMTPEEVVKDALDAVQAGLNDEIAAGAQTRKIYETFLADPKGLQAMMSTRLPHRA